MSGLSPSVTALGASRVAAVPAAELAACPTLVVDEHPRGARFRPLGCLPPGPSRIHSCARPVANAGDEMGGRDDER
jgi:hypothetical protein